MKKFILPLLFVCNNILSLVFESSNKEKRRSPNIQIPTVKCIDKRNRQIINANSKFLKINPKIKESESDNTPAVW